MWPLTAVWERANVGYTDGADISSVEMIHAKQVTTKDNNVQLF
jgi:hypothetical protein